LPPILPEALSISTGLAILTVGQLRQALTNCQAILQAGGAGLDDVIEVGILLTNPADFAGLNQEYARWFPSEPPTPASPSSASNCPDCSSRSG
jgi:enamine deaminase RidA (YjgF/YER057c/UK114 family)